MFAGDLDREGWKEQSLGLFDILMQSSPTIIVGRRLMIDRNSFNRTFQSGIFPPVRRSPL
jgi:hypothetical protein